MIRVFNQYVSTKALLLMMSEAILIVTSLIAAAALRASVSTLDFGALISAPNIAFQITLILVILQICFITTICMLRVRSVIGVSTCGGFCSLSVPHAS